VCQSEKKIRTVNVIATLILFKIGSYVKFCIFFNYVPDCEIVCQVCWFLFKNEKKIRTVNSVATLILVKMGRDIIFFFTF
jgi:hypothetical protein